MKPYIEWICHARLVSSWVFSHGDIALHAKSSVSGKETVVDWMLILVQNLRPWQTRTHCCRHKCFPVCQRAQHLLRTQILCPGHKKRFWFCSETFRVRNKCFPVCAAQETSWATMCRRLPGPSTYQIILCFHGYLSLGESPKAAECYCTDPHSVGKFNGSRTSPSRFIVKI